MSEAQQTINEVRETFIAEQATGCRGAGDYRAWAKQQGYPHLTVLDTTSSAGDWSFLVSQDGETWLVASQENNCPRPGFTREVSYDVEFYGTEEEAVEQAYSFYR